MKNIGILIVIITVLMMAGCKKEYVPQKGDTVCSPFYCIIFESKEGYNFSSAVTSLKKKYEKEYPKCSISKGRNVNDLYFSHDNRSFRNYGVIDRNGIRITDFFVDSKGCYYTLMPYSD